MLQQRLSAAESAARAAAQERDAARAQAKRSATALLAFVESLDDTVELGKASADPAQRAAAEQLAARAGRLLQAVGLVETARVGDRLDPAAHEVVQTVDPPPGRGSGEIVRVVQRGFRADGRVVRRAQIVVAK